MSSHSNSVESNLPQPVLHPIFKIPDGKLETLLTESSEIISKMIEHHSIVPRGTIPGHKSTGSATLGSQWPIKRQIIIYSCVPRSKPLFSEVNLQKAYKGLLTENTTITPPGSLLWIRSSIHIVQCSETSPSVIDLSPWRIPKYITANNQEVF